MEAKFKIIFLVSIFFIIGIFVGSFGLNYLNNHEFEDFDLYMLNDIERMSYNYHREFKSKAAGEAHSTYLLYSHRVWRAGRISDIDYHLHQAIGNLRFCISLEQREKYDYAKISCELAENQFNQLDKKNSFKEFRNIVDSEYFTLDMLLNNKLQEMKDPIYLNTDLEITSKNDLTPIVDEFGEDVFVMYNGDWGKNQRAEFEVSSPIADVNGAIGFFCMLVESLSMNAKKLWDESYSKTFSVGFDSGNSKSNLELKIDPQIVNRVSEIGASISIVIYPLDENE